MLFFFLFCSSRRLHTRFALVTGVQTCALPISGFSSGWELNRRENVFYLKPRNVDVDSNMMVRTATHSSIFELKVVATDWRVLEQAKRAGVEYTVPFRYPNSTESAAEADTAPGTDTAVACDQNGRTHGLTPLTTA